MPQLVSDLAPVVVATTTNVPTTTETVAATSLPLVQDSDQRQVYIHGWLDLSIGGSTTTVTLRIRRNSLTGTVISNPALFTFVAAQVTRTPIAIWAQDSAQNIAGSVYVMTVQQTAAVGAGTVNTALIILFAV
jgi:hypothetical protein